MKLIYMECTLNYMVTNGRESEVMILMECSEHFMLELGNYIIIDETKI